VWFSQEARSYSLATLLSALTVLCLARYAGERRRRWLAGWAASAALGLAGLAGLGWDRLVAGKSRRTAALAATFLALSLIALGAATALHDQILVAFRARPPAETPPPFGPYGERHPLRIEVDQLELRAHVACPSVPVQSGACGQRTVHGSPAR